MAVEKAAEGTGARLRIIRGVRSQEEFAELLGVGRATLQRYEADQRTPDGDLMARLWMLFRADPLWVLTGTSSSDPIWGANGWEAQAMTSLRALDDHTRQRVIAMLEAVAKLSGEIKP